MVMFNACIYQYDYEKRMDRYDNVYSDIVTYENDEDDDQ